MTTNQSRGWTGVLLYRRQVLKLAREMVFKGEQGRNHDCKRPDPRYKMNLYQRNNSFKRSFNDKIYIVSMGMNAKFKVDSHFSNA